MYCWFCVVLYIVFVYMCTLLLPTDVYPIAVKYILSNIHISMRTWLFLIRNHQHIVMNHLKLSNKFRPLINFIFDGVQVPFVNTDKTT